MKKGFFALALFLFVLQVPGFSDMIVMKAGQNIIGKIISENATQYIVQTEDGTLSIDKTVVEHVIKDSPEPSEPLYTKLDYDQYVHAFFNLSLVPPLQTDLISAGKPHIDNIQFGILASSSEIVWGFASSLIIVTSEEFKGYSLGLLHYAKGYAAGVQNGLVENLVKGNFEGWQFSAVNIVTGYASAFQMGGINFSTKFSGVQLGGINIGKTVAGLQIGAINFAVDSYHLPIGALNISLKGTLAMELWYDSLGMLNYTFKSGVKRFYYIYNLAYGTLNNVGEWGAGLGVRVTIDPIHINLEGSMNLMSYDTINFDILHSVNMMFRLYSGYPITKFLRITGGFTFNYLALTPNDPLININSIFGPVDLNLLFTYRKATVFGFFIGVEIDFARLME